MAVRWILMVAFLLGMVSLPGCRKAATSPQFKGTLPAGRIPNPGNRPQPPPEP